VTANVIAFNIVPRHFSAIFPIRTGTFSPVSDDRSNQGHEWHSSGILSLPGSSTLMTGDPGAEPHPGLSSSAPLSALTDLSSYRSK